MTVRIAVWSGPRNISTALMRSFENRPDCEVVDEPFYAAYLARTGLAHPGRAEVLASQPTSAEAVIAALLGPPPGGAAVHYSKQMAHHLDEEQDLAWTRALVNVLLIREPEVVVASYVRSREACEPADIGLLQQVRLQDYWASSGAPAPTLDTSDFLADPERHLRWLCAHAGIEFSERMLSWPPGPRPSDGVWAPHWYDAVWRSTGFEARPPQAVVLSAHDKAVAQACRPAYERLRGARVRLS